MHLPEGDLMNGSPRMKTAGQTQEYERWYMHIRAVVQMELRPVIAPGREFECPRCGTATADNKPLIDANHKAFCGWRLAWITIPEEFRNQFQTEWHQMSVEEQEHFRRRAIS